MIQIIQSSRHKSNDINGCGHDCCDDCDEEECQYEPCCDDCSVYYESDESYEEPIRGKDKIIGSNFECPHNIKLIPLPNLEERFVDYVAGPSGSGKSTIASTLASEWKKNNPKKNIYVFSRTDPRDDPILQ